MKLSMQFTIAITTFLLFFITILSAINYSFPVIFYLVIVGQISLLLMVYKILKDKYKTEKTFEDFYEDRSIKKEDLKFRQ